VRVWEQRTEKRIHKTMKKRIPKGKELTGHVNEILPGEGLEGRLMNSRRRLGSQTFGAPEKDRAGLGGRAQDLHFFHFPRISLTAGFGRKGEMGGKL